MSTDASANPQPRVETLREHLEAIQWECMHPRATNALLLPQQIAQIVHHAATAIEQLDASDAFGKGTIVPGGDFTRTHRLVPDPQEAPDVL